MRALTPLPLGAVELTHGTAFTRRNLTRDYVRSLKPSNLLLTYLLEAGRTQINEQPTDIHWGWESPTSMVRGHFVGKWMSACAHLWAMTADPWAKGLLDHVVDELALCQRENGGEWVAAIPEKYLHWIKRGKAVWAPMYVAHKPLMGLLEAYTLAGNDKALDVVVNAARWFTRFTDGMSRDELDDLLDWESGGIHELWADLYGITGEQAHLDLVMRFDRRRLIDRLVAGDDPLTNQHANQTVPEIMGAARAFEVTGETRWRDAVLAYWECAVTDRGWFATGGQTFGEYWTPPFDQAARLGATNQEHCVVFNMMRLADRLLQWTGEARFADYLERNRQNGTFSQQHAATGMVSYFLPLGPAGRKEWATPTATFSCCQGTMVQAGCRHGATAYYADAAGLTVAEYMGSVARWSHHGTPVTVTVRTYEEPPEASRANFDHGLPRHRPQSQVYDIEITPAAPVEFELRLRIPWWVSSPPTLTVDGVPLKLPHTPGTFHTEQRTWTGNRLRLELPMAITAESLPDRPDVVAFMEGPLVLAGLVDEARTLHGKTDDPSSMIVPVAEYEGGLWRTRFSTQGQAHDFELIPLRDVVDETYTVYFSVTP